LLDDIIGGAAVSLLYSCLATRECAGYCCVHYTGWCRHA